MTTPLETRLAEAGGTIRLEVNNMIAAVVLLSQGEGWELAGVARDARPGFYVFHVDVPAGEGEQQRAREIIELCRPGARERFNMMVHLGRFQEAFERVKHAMRPLDKVRTTRGPEPRRAYEGRDGDR